MEHGGNHYCCSPIISELHSLSPWYVAGALWFIWRINKNEMGQDKHLIVWARPSWILFTCQGNSLCSRWLLHHQSWVPECWNGLTSLPTGDGHVMCAKKKKKKLSFLRFQGCLLRDFPSQPTGVQDYFSGRGRGASPCPAPTPASCAIVAVVFSPLCLSMVTEALPFLKPIWIFPSCLHAPPGFDLEEWGKEQVLWPILGSLL